MQPYPIGMISGLTALFLRLVDIATFVAATWAFIDCLRRRPDAFPAVGRHSKGLWLGLTGGSAVVAFLDFYPLGLLGIFAIAIAAIYLLDIRPRIAEITRGR